MRKLAHFSLLVLTLGVCVTCAATERADAWKPQWKFHGGGFHRHLEVDVAPWMDVADVAINLPKSFFFDVREAEQYYRIVGDCARPNSDKTDPIDLLSYYLPPSLSSAHVFNIESPTFHVSYDVNLVNLSIQRRADLPACVRGNVHLTLPIHMRYEDLDTTSPFSLIEFMTRQNSMVQRCLTDIRVAWQSKQMGPGVAFADVHHVDEEKSCVMLPVGILSNLPFVYNTLISLLVVAAVIIVTSV